VLKISKKVSIYVTATSSSISVNTKTPDIELQLLPQAIYAVNFRFLLLKIIGTIIFAVTRSFDVLLLINSQASVHRRRSSVNFFLHFCPKTYAWKNNKMPEFYMIIARKIFSYFYGAEGHVPICPPSSTLRPMPVFSRKAVVWFACLQCNANRIRVKTD